MNANLSTWVVWGLAMLGGLVAWLVIYDVAKQWWRTVRNRRNTRYRVKSDALFMQLARLCGGRTDLAHQVVMMEMADNRKLNADLAAQFAISKLERAGGIGHLSDRDRPD